MHCKRKVKLLFESRIGKIYLLLISMDNIAIELSKLPFIETINSLKQEIDSYKPVSKEIEDKVFQKLKLDWNYNSNAIEGNKLNYGETVAFLMHGITAKGKTLKDHLDIKGHNEAIGFLLSLIKEDRDISESDIRALHEMILVEEYETDALTPDGQPTKKKIKLGTYKTTPNSVKTRTGEMHYYASVEETPALMNNLMNWYNENKTNKEIHPIVLASLFHFKFVAIHPFDDGNGRLARILMNLILLRTDLPVIVVKNDDKQNYYGVLSQADNQQFIPLIEYMCDLLQHSLNLYLKGIKGESIEDESDIDKEIALFKKSIRLDQIINIELSDKIKNSTIRNNLVPLHTALYQKLKLLLDDLFIENKFTIKFDKLNSIENVYVDSLEEVLNRIEELDSYLLLGYFWKSFKIKEADYRINISVHLEIDFEDAEYKIYCSFDKHDRSKPIFKKYYDNNINQEEIKQFVTQQVNDIMNFLKINK